MIVSSGAYSVTTPNPQLGNSESLSLKVQLVRTMAGTVYPFKAVPTSTYNLQVNNMMWATAKSLMELIHARAAEDITFAWGTFTIVGKLTNEPTLSGSRNRSSIIIEVYDAGL